MLTRLHPPGPAAITRRQAPNRLGARGSWPSERSACGPCRLGLRRRRPPLLHAARLALEVAEVVELGPADLGVLDDLDLLDRLRVQREDPLHALSEGHLAHGHGRAGAAAL